MPTQGWLSLHRNDGEYEHYLVRHDALTVVSEIRSRIKACETELAARLALQPYIVDNTLLPGHYNDQRRSEPLSLAARWPFAAYGVNVEFTDTGKVKCGPVLEMIAEDECRVVPAPHQQERKTQAATSRIWLREAARRSARARE